MIHLFDAIYNFFLKYLDFHLLLFILLFYLAIYPYIDYFKSRKDRVNGPIPYPFLGHLNILFGNLSDNFYHLTDKYGGICELKMFGFRTVLVGDPTFLKDLFSPSVHSPFLRRIPLLPGFKELGMDKEGLLLNLDIPKWRHNRKFFQQSLSPPSFIELSTLYTRDCCEEMMTYWNNINNNQVVRLDEWYRSFTSDMMGLVAAGSKEESLKILYKKTVDSNAKLSFDSEFVDLNNLNKLSNGEQYRRLRSDYADAIAFFVFLPKFVWNLPWFREKCKYFRQVLVALSDFEIKFIKERKALIEEQKYINTITTNKNIISPNLSGTKVRSDFLTMLLTMNTDSNPSPEDIKQNIREMFGAGTGTTTTSLCSIAYLLAKHPEVEKRMVNEILSVVGPTKNIGSYDLSKLVYTEAVIYEAMRLYPVIPITFRYTPDVSTQIDGHTFPPNTIFGINLGHIQRNEKYFKDPNTFNPERFLGNWRETLPQFAFSPFGQGMKSCPGKHFAMTEIKVILATIYRKYTFRLVNPKEPLHLKFTLVNDISKLEVFLEKRKLE
ncbi:22197_t:CDS:1 [Dentiscutata erythropus]|uniref:22197_t:CDS:1 n=1 Tax=Dentiscutata erythropus TaxID=1348616 RepID=A0A9N9AZ69_9GLOM|nr:22197_t:CDS:1 [Dentiscutata erythropus]